MLADTRTMLAWCCRVRFLVMAGAQCLLSGNPPYKRVCWRFHTTASSICLPLSHPFALSSSQYFRFCRRRTQNLPPSSLFSHKLSQLSARPIRYMKNDIDFFFKWHRKTNAKWVSNEYDWKMRRGKKVVHNRHSHDTTIFAKL